MAKFSAKKSGAEFLRKSGAECGKTEKSGGQMAKKSGAESHRNALF